MSNNPEPTLQESIQSQNPSVENESGPGLLAHFLVILMATTCLSFGFVENTFGVADEDWFKTHQKDTEGHVFGNIVRSSSHGLWEHSGFNGVTQTTEPRWKLERHWTGGLAQKHEEMYLEGTYFDYYNPYFSQPGAQAWIFIAMDKVLDWEKHKKVDLFRWITGVTSALSLAFILSWILRIGGWGATIAAGLSMLYSPWLTVFGGNLWWFFASFFLPMVLTSLATLSSRFRPGAWFFLSCFSLLIKGLLTGFEYISTTLVMSQIPLILDQIRRNRPMQTALGNLIASSAGAIFGVVLTMVILAVQISIYRQDSMAGIDHLVHSYGKRSTGAKDNLSYSYNRGLEADVGKVIQKYRSGVCYDLESKPLRERKDPSQDTFMKPFRFNDLISTLKGLTVIWLLWAWISSRRRWALLSFLLATWVSFLAPLSWYIFFKAHSTVHWHMNYVCWHMPFSFLVAAMAGLTSQSFLVSLWKGGSRVVKRFRRKTSPRTELKESELSSPSP